MSGFGHHGLFDEEKEARRDHIREQIEAEKVRQLMETIKVSQSGYAGINRRGEIVDRREEPGAKPIQKNRMLGISKPKKL